MTPALNQCKLSVVHHDQPTIDYCRTAGITYQSYSPLCGGFNGSSCSRSGGENVMTRPDVLAIADSHGVSAAQIGLKLGEILFLGEGSGVREKKENDEQKMLHYIEE